MVNEQGLEKMMLSSVSPPFYSVQFSSLWFWFEFTCVCECECVCVSGVGACWRAWDIFTITNARMVSRMFSVWKIQKTKINKLHSTLNRSIFTHWNSHDDLCNVHDDCAQKFCPPLFSLFLFWQYYCEYGCLNTNTTTHMWNNFIYDFFESNRYHYFNFHSFVTFSKKNHFLLIKIHRVDNFARLSHTHSCTPPCTMYLFCIYRV